jgi:hypothetical protein
VDVGGNLESQQLALARVDLPLAVAGTIAPVGAGAAVPETRSLRTGFVVVLREPSILATEVYRPFTGTGWNEIVGRQVIVDLGIDGPVPV